MIQPSLGSVLWLENVIMRRHTIVLDLIILSGQMSLYKFIFLMKRFNTPNYHVCNLEEDVFHILMESTRNVSLKRQIFQRSYNI